MTLPQPSAWANLWDFPCVPPSNSHLYIFNYDPQSEDDAVIFLYPIPQVPARIFRKGESYSFPASVDPDAVSSPVEPPLGRMVFKVIGVAQNAAYVNLAQGLDASEGLSTPSEGPQTTHSTPGPASPFGLVGRKCGFLGAGMIFLVSLFSSQAPRSRFQVPAWERAKCSELPRDVKRDKRMKKRTEPCFLLFKTGRWNACEIALCPVRQNAWQALLSHWR